MNALFSQLFQLLDIVCHLLPVSRHRVFFVSFHGQYNDNPRAISEKLHDLHPNIKQYWAISEKSKGNDIPDYVQIVRYNTLGYYVAKNRCRVIVENGAGDALLYSPNKWIYKLKRHLKNPKQFDLSTWHGNPIKHIGAQIPGTEIWDRSNVFTSSDMLIAGCQQVKGIFEQAFLSLMPILLTGTPRTDILFDKSAERKKLTLKKLGLPSDKKIILYAPTYRYSPKDSGIEQLKMIDFTQLFAALAEKFGGEWILVMRVHNVVLLTIESSGMLNAYNGKVFDGNRFDDMNDYLSVADVLLTDYSGCIYDVALTEKPCFLFAHDRENYEQRERGLYTPLDAFPYTFASSFKELLLNISSFSKMDNENKRISFLEKIGNVEDGHSSERVVSIIHKQLIS